MNITFFLCIAILILSVLFGWMKGLIRTIVALVSWVAILLLAGWLNPHISKAIVNFLVTQGKTPDSFKVSCITYVVTALVAVAVVNLVGHLLGLLGELPVLSFFNRVLGALFGLARGIVLIWLFFIFLQIIKDTSVGASLLAMVEESPILIGLYQMNPILKIVKQILLMI